MVKWGEYGEERQHDAKEAYNSQPSDLGLRKSSLHLFRKRSASSLPCSANGAFRSVNGLRLSPYRPSLTTERRNHRKSSPYATSLTKGDGRIARNAKLRAKQPIDEPCILRYDGAMNKDAVHTNRIVAPEGVDALRPAGHPADVACPNSEPPQDNAPRITEHAANKACLREDAGSTAHRPKKRQHRHIPLWVYKCMLVLAAAIWGLGTVVIKDAVDTFSPLWLVGLRFSIAGVVLAVICWKSVRKNLDRDTLGAGAFLGLFVAAQFVFNTAGLTDTTAAKSAFLTGTYCAFVPFLAWAISRIRPTIYNIVAMALCVVGVGFVSFADGFESFSFGFGEAITLLSALFVGLHIAFMAKLSVGRDPITLTVVQFIVAGILGSAIAFAIDGSLDTAALGNPELLGSILYLALFASCLSLTLQNIGLAHVPPAPAALLLATESVFGVLFSIVFLHEIVTAFMVIGFTLIGAGIVVSEALPLKKRRIPIEEVVEEEMRASQEG